MPGQTDDFSGGRAAHGASADSADSHVLAASLYTFLFGMQELISSQAAGQPSRADVRRAVLGSLEDFSRLRSSFGPEAKLMTHLGDGQVTSCPVGAIIDMVLSIRPGFEAWNGDSPVPEDCVRAATRLRELSGWPN